VAHEEIEARHRAVMNDIAKLLEGAFNPDGGKDYGFTLLVFSMNDGGKGRMNYISNAVRADMLTAMKELIANFEGRVMDEPKGKQ